MASGKTVLFVLQNAWRRGAAAGEREDQHSQRAWERLLWRSQTGKRLREMIPDGIEYQVVNASLDVGSSPSSTPMWAEFAADALLMRSRLRRLRPALVVLCGKWASKLAPIVRSEGYPCKLVPHPAWRRLSKAHTARIRKDITKILRVLGMVDKLNGLVSEGYPVEEAARLAGDMHNLEVIETHVR